MATEMKITAISPWFGSKRTLAARIVEELGPHESYFDPFCGSLAVPLAKAPSRQETCCDLHGELTNLAWILQNETTAVALYDRLTRTLFLEGLLQESRAILQAGDASPADRAYWFFIHSWCGRNGMAGSALMNFQLAVRWTASGGSPTVRFRNAIESIPAWHERLRNMVILNRDAFDVVPRIPDDPGVAIYCDPPYLHSTRSVHADGGYRHDFEEYDAGLFGERDDHAKLADELSRFARTRVVVSYYAHPRLLLLYPPPRWTHIDCTMNKNLHVQNRRGAAKADAPEVLIVNGPSFRNPEA